MSRDLRWRGSREKMLQMAGPGKNLFSQIYLSILCIQYPIFPGFVKCFSALLSVILFPPPTTGEGGGGGGGG